MRTSAEKNHNLSHGSEDGSALMPTSHTNGYTASLTPYSSDDDVSGGDDGESEPGDTALLEDKTSPFMDSLALLASKASELSDPSNLNGPEKEFYDLKLHQLGRLYGRYSEKGKRILLIQASILWSARLTYGKLGRGSQFRSWLKRYAVIEPKTAYRHANIIEYFTAGDPDKLSSLIGLVDYFTLTALYDLSVETVPETARTEALRLASTGETVTRAVAASLIEQSTVPANFRPNKRLTNSRPQILSKKIVLSDGAIVSIRSENDDFVAALDAAKEQLVLQNASAKDAL